MTKKIPTLAEFNQLTEELQLQLLQRDGVHVGKRLVNGQPVILFQLAGFYVEVSYTKYRKEISGIATTEDADIVTPYLSQIHIQGLDKNNLADE